MANKSEKNRRKHEIRRRKNDLHLRELAAINLFRSSTQRILDTLEIPGLFKELPRDEISFYHKARVGSPRLVSECGKKIPHRIFKEMCSVLSTVLKGSTIKLGKGEITIEEYLTAGMALSCLESRLGQKNSFSPSLLSMLKILNENLKLKQEDLMMTVLSSMYIFACLFSRINGTLYNIRTDVFTENNRNKTQASFSCCIRPAKAETKNIVVDGIPRHSYRVGLPGLEDFIWMQITGRELGLNNENAEKIMDVYMQSHAFVRLRERIDTFHPAFLNLTLFFSLLVKKITPLSNGTGLLEYCDLEILNMSILMKKTT